MKLTIDTDARTIEIAEGGEPRRIDLFSAEGYARVATLWRDVGWVQKHSYSFTWMGRPIIQLPEDMIRLQEAVHAVRPDVIVETGVAHGGSLVFHASLMKAMGHGRRVIGVDVEIRPHNRAALESHPLAPMIDLIEGDSVAPETVGRAASLIAPGDTVMVILDSNHTRAHVAAELAAYAGLVSPGSYLLVTDGIMGDLAGLPRTLPEWQWDNPRQAAVEFLAAHPEFEEVGPPRPFDESAGCTDITYFPGGWLRRRR